MKLPKIQPEVFEAVWDKIVVDMDRGSEAFQGLLVGYSGNEALFEFMKGFINDLVQEFDCLQEALQEANVPVEGSALGEDAADIIEKLLPYIISGFLSVPKAIETQIEVKEMERGGVGPW